MADAIAVLDAAGAGRAWVIGHSWGGHLAMYLAVRYPARVAGLVIADPLGAVPDGRVSNMEQNLTERIRPELAARARELHERALAGQGTAEDALESLAIVWPGYFSSPQAAPPRPPLSLSAECYAGTFASIQAHFGQHTLERSLPALAVPAVFVLGAASPIPARHGVASAGLIPGARHQIEDCGHFPWLEQHYRCCPATEPAEPAFGGLPGRCLSTEASSGWPSPHYTAGTRTGVPQRSCPWPSRCLSGASARRFAPGQDPAAALFPGDPVRLVLAWRRTG